MTIMDVLEKLDRVTDLAWFIPITAAQRLLKPKGLTLIHFRKGLNCDSETSHLTGLVTQK